MHECHDLYDIIINSTSSSVDAFNTSYNKGFTHYRKVFGISELYNLDLDSSLILVASELKNFKATIDKKIITSSYPRKSWDSNTPLIPLDEETLVFLSVGRSITKLKDKITRKLKDTEINH